MRRVLGIGAIIALFLLTVVALPHYGRADWAGVTGSLLALWWPVLESRRTAQALRDRPEGAASVKRVLVGGVAGGALSAFAWIVPFSNPAERTLPIFLTAALTVALFGMIVVVVGLWVVERRQRKAATGIQ